MPSTADPLRIGLLQCGAVHPALVDEFGDYVDLFDAILGDQGVQLRVYDATSGQLPAHADECDGWLVSGSASSVYDELPWIDALSSTLLAILDQEVPLVAICFGHQLLAQALGASVTRADVGWQVGVQRYDLVDGATLPHGVGFPDAHAGGFHLIASHQDQVDELPPGAALVATAERCPIAAYTVGPRVLAIQAHPEFVPGLSRRLIEVRREAVGPAVEPGLASLDQPLDQTAVARWMAATWRT